MDSRAMLPAPHLKHPPMTRANPQNPVEIIVVAF